jgi:hypothetical protein
MKLPRHVARILVALVLLVGLQMMASADEFHDAVAAYDRGDYETALRLFKPLAEEAMPSPGTDSD